MNEISNEDLRIQLALDSDCTSTNVNVDEIRSLLLPKGLNGKASVMLQEGSTSPYMSVCDTCVKCTSDCFTGCTTCYTCVSDEVTGNIP